MLLFDQSLIISLLLGIASQGRIGKLASSTRTEYRRGQDHECDRIAVF